MGKSLQDFRLLSFDCYGTLIDWETGIWDALQPLLMANGEESLDRARALRVYGDIEHRLETEQPDVRYPGILSQVHDELAANFGLTSTASLDEAFGRSVAQWPAFADTANALRSLKQRYKLVVLSNVDGDSFAASNQKLGVSFDALYLAEDIGSYKPDDRNFQYLLDRVRKDFGIEKHEILHTAQSLLHDHQCANRFGIANAWIDRQGLAERGEWGATRAVEQWPEFDFRFDSMQAMAAAVIAGDPS